MVAYSFRSRFVEPIQARAKRQTIRAPRRRHARPGEALQLYTGMRTKQCRLIGLARCASVWPIRLSIKPALHRHDFGEVEYGGRVLNMIQDLDAFARTDGFDDWWHMRLFWLTEHGPHLDAWEGVMIRWEEFSVG
jgi:hypothetical protein